MQDQNQMNGNANGMVPSNQETSQVDPNGFNNNNGLNNMPPAPTKKSKTPLIIAIVIVALLLIGGGTYFYISSNASQQEEMAYEVLENNNNPQDYEDFLEKYPNSEHADEVRDRLQKLQEMLSKWNSIALSNDVNDFINFKDQYTDPQYNRLCDIKIDSLDFITAQRLNTPEAFQHYLDSHPDGRYASEASVAQGSLRDQEVTETDREQITEVLTDFFNGFANRDESKICANISSTMTTFLHKQNATKADVLSKIDAMFNEHIQGCQFNVNRDTQITRKNDSSGNAMFTVTFTVDQHISRDNEGKTFGQYKCVANINAQMLITSLTMQEISQQ